MTKCKHCNAPVTLAPDGDPRYLRPATKPKKQDALTLIERIYYMEGKSAEWRAAQMNGVARDAQDGADLSRYRRFFSRGEGR